MLPVSFWSLFASVWLPWSPICANIRFFTILWVHLFTVELFLRSPDLFDWIFCLFTYFQASSLIISSVFDLCTTPSPVSKLSQVFFATLRPHFCKLWLLGCPEDPFILNFAFLCSPRDSACSFCFLNGFQAFPLALWGFYATFRGSKTSWKARKAVEYQANHLVALWNESAAVSRLSLPFRASLRFFEQFCTVAVPLQLSPAPKNPKKTFRCATWCGIIAQIFSAPFAH